MEQGQLSVLTEITHPSLPFKLFFEDDGRAAYAYLVENVKGIVADVWIFNSCDTPDEPEWSNSDLMPFRNSSAYVADERPFPLPSQPSQVSVEWKEEGGRVGALVTICGVRAAELFEGDKPGRSIMAKRDGPLARVLS